MRLCLSGAWVCTTGLPAATMFAGQCQGTACVLKHRLVALPTARAYDPAHPRCLHQKPHCPLPPCPCPAPPFAAERPKNSALEVDLDFETTVKPPPQVSRGHHLGLRRGQQWCLAEEQRVAVTLLLRYGACLE